MITASRTTKYSLAVQESIRMKGHATNAEIFEQLRGDYPELSATTVHRVTSRLVQRGLIGLAPQARDGAARFDANIAPHDHFSCSHCSGLRDVVLDRSIFQSLEKELGGCKITGQLLVQGTCSRCNARGEQ